jgi:hypothetical protein
MRAIELNDAGIAVHSAEDVLAESPGYALLGDAETILGAAAEARARVQPLQAHDRFWEDLDLEPLARPAGRMRNRADIACAHLDQVWRREAGSSGEQALLVVPGNLSRQQLGLVLGIARECGIEVAGLIDAAVAASAEPSPGRSLLHLDMTLHRAVLTRLTQGARLSRASVELSDRTGIAALRNAWVRAIAALFVRETRFDALHQGETEQALYDGLSRWIEAIDRDGSVVIELQGGGKTHAITLRREHLIDAAQPHYTALRELIAANTRPGEPLSLQLTQRVATLPGCAASLGQLPGCTIVELDASAAARGALALASHITGLRNGDSLSFVTHVPWRLALTSVDGARVAGDGTESHPTHVLYQSRAHAIGPEPLVVGAEIPADSRGFNLAGALNGVSRRHCSIYRNGQAVVLEDHSTYGTFVNGMRVQGRATLTAGDRVRLGTPGEELLLITVA